MLFVYFFITFFCCTTEAATSFFKYDDFLSKPVFTEEFIDQFIDHFNFNSCENKTYSQRYLITSMYLNNE